MVNLFVLIIDSNSRKTNDCHPLIFRQLVHNSHYERNRRYSDLSLTKPIPTEIVFKCNQQICLPVQYSRECYRKIDGSLLLAPFSLSIYLQSLETRESTEQTDELTQNQITRFCLLDRRIHLQSTSENEEQLQQHHITSSVAYVQSLAIQSVSLSLQNI